MKRSLFALALAAAMPFAAVADELSYNHVQAGYLRTDVGGDADGYAYDGSWAFHPNFHVFGGYADQNVKEHYGVDFDQWNVGVGYNQSIGSKADFVSRLSYQVIDSGDTEKFDGYTLEAGIRGQVMDHLEAWALMGHGDINAKYGGELYARLGGMVEFNDTWGVAGDVRFVAGDTQWFVGPRFSW